MGLLMKETIEGNYDNAEALGLLSIMDGLYGNVKTEYESSYSKVKAIAEGIKQEREYQIRDKQQPVMYGAPFGKPPGGGAGGIDGDASTPPGSAKAKSIDETVKDIKTKINEKLMRDVVQKLDQVYARKLNPALSAAVVGEPTLYMNLYQNYIDKKNAEGQTIATKALIEEMEANNLVPKHVLKITGIDKAVFVFLTLVIRLIALTFTTFLINKGNLKTLPWALGVFLFLYAIVYIGFVMFVNLDMYRLRVLFNYVNMHVNTQNLLLHLVLMWVFSLVIFLIMWNLNFPVRGVKVTAISDEEKGDLIYRLEVLTMIVWIFLVLMIAIM
jgi:hypothetical protein